jgi:hypothetical protein
LKNRYKKFILERKYVIIILERLSKRKILKSYEKFIKMIEIPKYSKINKLLKIFVEIYSFVSKKTTIITKILDKSRKK